MLREKCTPKSLHLTSTNEASAGACSSIETDLSSAAHIQPLQCERYLSLLAGQQLPPAALLVPLDGSGQFMKTVLPDLRKQSVSNRISRVLEFIAANIGSELTVPQLAEVAFLSPRQLARSFKAETGLTPAKAVEFLRLQLARERALTTRQPMKRIAAEFGFTNMERMRRTFSRNLGLPPGRLRKRHSGRVVASTAA